MVQKSIVFDNELEALIKARKKRDHVSQAAVVRMAVAKYLGSKKAPAIKFPEKGTAHFKDGWMQVQAGVVVCKPTTLSQETFVVRYRDIMKAEKLIADKENVAVVKKDGNSKIIDQHTDPKWLEMYPWVEGPSEKSKLIPVAPLMRVTKFCNDYYGGTYWTYGVQVRDGWAYASSDGEVIARVPIDYVGDPVNIHRDVIKLLPKVDSIQMSGDLYFQLGDTWLYVMSLEQWPEEVFERHFPAEASEALAEDWRLHGEATHISVDGSRWYGDGIEGVRTHIAAPEKSDKLYI